MHATLDDHLTAHLADARPPALCVAFSGGPDSTALLHALAGRPRERPLRALHVDHGLHADSGRWAEHAQACCRQWDVPCEVLRVRVDLDAGLGIEGSARRARYDALAAALHPGEWLLTAHHRDDQVETVLLKLLRGAGPEGLGGMREQRPLGAGTLWRPLLALPRAALLDHVRTHALACLDDPANADPRLARHALRHEVLPRLATHWPHAADSIIRSAALCRDAADALRAQWQPAFDALHDPASGSLDAAVWRALAPGLREPLLDHWLHGRGLRAPTGAQRAQILRQLDAREGRVPCIRWPGVALHVWRGRLWAVPTPAPSLPLDWQATWHGGTLALPDGGTLTLDGTLAAPLTVRLRRGGERLRPAGDRHTRELRDLFQTGAMPPWLRPACPLLYEDDTLIAVADRWLSDRGVALLGAPGERLRWQPGRGVRSEE
ncbi:tRNA lysidine(34) synthetase TilS [Dyella sp. KRB-257]|uniref:tRNA lysidine(34) synthetase TilS n=1 Tax=Dyella sp. KRB-257 TaxID=3400915 RepID=UPI003C0A7453